MTNEEMILKMVREGVSADELTKLLNEAEETVKAEKAAEEKAKREAELAKSKLDDARNDLALSYADYYLARGVITEDEWEETADSMEKQLKEIEKFGDFLEKKVSSNPDTWAKSIDDLLKLWF